MRVSETRLPCAALRLLQHGRIAVYPHHHPIATDPLRQRERVRAWTTAQVQHAMAALRLHPVIAVVLERAQESRGTLEIGRIDVTQCACHLLPCAFVRVDAAPAVRHTWRLLSYILKAAILYGKDSPKGAMHSSDHARE